VKGEGERRRWRANGFTRLELAIGLPTNLHESSRILRLGEGVVRWLGRSTDSTDCVDLDFGEGEEGEGER